MTFAPAEMIRVLFHLYSRPVYHDIRPIKSYLVKKKSAFVFVFLPLPTSKGQLPLSFDPLCCWNLPLANTNLPTGCNSKFVTVEDYFFSN